MLPITTIPQILKIRLTHIQKMDILVEKLLEHTRSPVDDDESTDYEIRSTAGSKRSFDDFLSDQLNENDDIIGLAKELLYEVQAHRKMLKRE